MQSCKIVEKMLVKFHDRGMNERRDINVDDKCVIC